MCAEVQGFPHAANGILQQAPQCRLSGLHLRSGVLSQAGLLDSVFVEFDGVAVGVLDIDRRPAPASLDGDADAPEPCQNLAPLARRHVEAKVMEAPCAGLLEELEPTAAGYVQPREAIHLLPRAACTGRKLVDQHAAEISAPTLA